MLAKPNESLAVEIARSASYFSDKKVEFLIWIGADPAAKNIYFTNKSNVPSNFILTSAIRHKRFKVIPKLIGNYTKEQELIALSFANGNHDLVIVLKKLFRESKNIIDKDKNKGCRSISARKINHLAPIFPLI